MVAPDEHVNTQLPKWILENQQIGWLGFWEPTPIYDPKSWTYALTSSAYSPSPFEGWLERDGQKVAVPDVHADVLHRLVYPEVASAGASSLSSSSHLKYTPQVDTSTDPEGWTYGSSATRIQRHRLGGRATPRFGDRFRRRWWVQGGAKNPLRASPLPDSSAAVYDSLSEAVREVLGSRSIMRMPADPTALARRLQKDNASFDELCRRLPPWKDLQTLGELCVASLYSRGAYAYTGRLGKFDSVTSGALVFSVQRAAFDLAEGVDDESNARAFLDMLALTPDDILVAAWRSEGAFQPAFVVALDHEMSWIVVAIRGTLSGKDILTDMAVSCAPFLEGTAHMGFAKTAANLLAAIKDRLQTELASRPHYKLVFCGHSMGGAVAAMCVSILRQEGWAQNCCAYTIGTPAVLSRNICERLMIEEAVFTVVNGKDWSPRSSMSSVQELMDDLCDLSITSTVWRAAMGKEMPQPTVQQPGVEQLPPGKILQVVPSGCGVAPELLLASPTDYRHSMPVWPDVAAHIPLSYVDGLAGGLATMLLESKHRCSMPDDLGEAVPSLVSTLIRPTKPASATDSNQKTHCFEGINDVNVTQLISAAGCDAFLPMAGETLAGVASPRVQRALRALRRVAHDPTSVSLDHHLPREPDRARELVKEHLGDLN